MATTQSAAPYGAKCKEHAPKAALIRVQKQLTQAEPPGQDEGSRGIEHWSTQATRGPAAHSSPVPPQCKRSARFRGPHRCSAQALCTLGALRPPPLALRSSHNHCTLASGCDTSLQRPNVSLLRTVETRADGKNSPAEPSGADPGPKESPRTDKHGHRKGGRLYPANVKSSLCCACCEQKRH